MEWLTRIQMSRLGITPVLTTAKLPLMMWSMLFCGRSLLQNNQAWKMMDVMMNLTNVLKVYKETTLFPLKLWAPVIGLADKMPWKKVLST